MDITLSNIANTTEVEGKDLPVTPKPTYVNAPENLEDAIQRILFVEMLLEDLSRAVEISQITGNPNVTDVFYSNATEYLRDKIQIQQPEQGDFKITIVTDKETTEEEAQ